MIDVQEDFLGTRHDTAPIKTPRDSLYIILLFAEIRGQIFI